MFKMRRSPDVCKNVCVCGGGGASWSEDDTDKSYGTNRTLRKRLLLQDILKFSTYPSVSWRFAIAFPLVVLRIMWFSRPRRGTPVPS